jgi:hypothetical protein
MVRKATFSDAEVSRHTVFSSDAIIIETLRITFRLARQIQNLYIINISQWTLRRMRVK